MKFTLHLPALCATLLLSALSVHATARPATLEDLKKLDIICLVPGWLPEGYHFTKTEIDREDVDGHQKAKGEYPTYSLEYGNGKKGKFTIESARIGIGDRNLDQDDRAQESHFTTKRFGPVYFIYFPPGKSGVKDRINANWIEDANLKAEKPKGDSTPHGRGRFHGLSGFGMTLADFEKIVQSLHPIREANR